MGTTFGRPPIDIIREAAKNRNWSILEEIALAATPELARLAITALSENGRNAEVEKVEHLRRKQDEIRKLQRKPKE